MGVLTAVMHESEQIKGTLRLLSPLNAVPCRVLPGCIDCPFAEKSSDSQKKKNSFFSIF